MISPTNGHSIKHKEAEKLNKEVEAFLSNGGTKTKHEVKEKKARAHDSSYYNSEFIAASRQRKEFQVPFMKEYANWGGKGKWVKLSDAINNKIPASQLACVSRGETTVKCLNNWREIVAAIEIFRGNK